MWNVVKNQYDIENLNDLFGDFHDSILKEFHYFSGSYVDESLNMYPINDLRKLSVVFERQYANPMSIELEFEGLVKLKIEPVDDQYTSEIQCAKLKMENGYFYWSDSDNELSISGNEICATSLKWRIVE